MIRFKLNDEAYGLGFQYATEPGGTRQTHARVWRLGEDGKPEGSLVTLGISRCHPKDNFQKERGRKLALARALSEWSLTKEERQAVWLAYLGRKA